ncbi:hypothetical protein P175DRAFT_0497291 [Aspergillus ochraceoroseus IBT 24754]|uniref:Uncharacterized protein n=3 Tax=Aspergillus subgen. Nidulantes TaxID=2720870 RepID=A0A0F8UB00_9EURO|nr:uncharacterized protein P175DRAFT_0497291 [Aspergillus ochraceoroseus IBT 24754]KKK16919.1 hypothetical protein ARAM_002666 [Aspergillus rambellii]KKK19685.1 hypothetical protein AOCH_000846 [Aspergillus ochraceoroseus]PTU24171.1 hypothetical protein P175DRAFT_0497291 [Aspergillus ochraceoroseus IBT 24754]
MKFSLATIAAFASAVSAATLPAAFTLVAQSGSTIVTDGEYLYQGPDAAGKEIAIFHSGTNGAVSFTSKSETPTGWQNIYVIENAVDPVGLTRPHSGAIPDGGNMLGFGVNDQGYFTHDGNDYFSVDGYGESPEKTIFWYGSHNSEYMATYLTVKEYKE